ncbi:hypothetical protein H2199_000795 [Coniosporium tulheliwenetii]|uniref:Uncharacterized protein n=1 Tax=Coniosporium tulheliwenetii TaxID=3383036 RepID=A0ACC2ZN02_9PEZI|nr:hypothetical protein H2199_000795 [Cladosporium sp. JES 115]
MKLIQVCSVAFVTTGLVAALPTLIGRDGGYYIRDLITDSAGQKYARDVKLLVRSDDKGDDDHDHDDDDDNHGNNWDNNHDDDDDDDDDKDDDGDDDHDDHDGDDHDNGDDDGDNDDKHDGNGNGDGDDDDNDHDDNDGDDHGHHHGDNHGHNKRNDGGKNGGKNGGNSGGNNGGKNGGNNGGNNGGKNGGNNDGNNGGNKKNDKMPPKFDPNEVKVIHLRATGGEVGASSALAPKIGPLGLSPKKVGEDIAKATGDWKGLRVTVKLTIQNRQAAVSVVPSASSLVIKALKEPPRDRKKEKNIKHTKSIPLDEIIEIARTMRFKSMAKDLKGTVKEILGTAFSTGCQVDGRSPKEISDDIESGEIEIPEE